MSELEKRKLGWIAKLAKPFSKDNTADWKKRREWMSAIEDIIEASTQAEVFLEKNDEGNRDVPNGAIALAEVELAFERLCLLRAAKE